MNKDALFKHVAAMGYRATHDEPIPNCPQPETPIRDRAWTDEQRLARLRECLGKAVKAVNGPLLTDKSNEQAGWAAVSFLQSHGAELLSILDAEGDGGAVGEASAYGLAFPGDVKRGRLNHCCIFGTREDAEAYSSRCLDKPMVVPLCTQPARSGVVRDEDVDAACLAYIAADRFLLDGAVDSMREPMRAALEHFAKRSDEDVRDAERWRYLRREVISASWLINGGSLVKALEDSCDPSAFDRAIDAARKGERHER